MLAMVATGILNPRMQGLPPHLIRLYCYSLKFHEVNPLMEDIRELIKKTQCHNVFFQRPPIVKLS